MCQQEKKLKSVSEGENQEGRTQVKVVIRDDTSQENKKVPESEKNQKLILRTIGDDKKNAQENLDINIENLMRKYRNPTKSQ